jgi:mannosylglycerate hydrolase
MSTKQDAIYLFSSTHWDREWYQSFQGFRYRLVTMMNEMIDVLENNPDFEVFHMDGQTIVLDDFLEIEPEKREQLAKLIEEKRLLIGPWYVMPDEFLLSGESLIRNLQLGHQQSREWGTDAWKYGYICDIFGHIAQMPQVFNGFDIRYALLGRGTNEHTTPSHFRWQSPDGSECITFKLPDQYGYGAFFSDVILKAREGQLSEDKVKELIRSHIESEGKRSPIPVKLLMDGLDHEHIHKETPEYLRMIREVYPEAEVMHTSLEEMGQQLEEYQDQMPVKSGELNEPAKVKAPYLHLITHTLSSRYPLKQANDECQALLEKWVDPLTAIAEQSGLSIQKTYVDLAYKYLMQNHPHDSICGCSIDQVHKDMEYRFDQTRQIAQQIISNVITENQKRIADDPDSRHRVLTCYNPLPFLRKEVITVDLDFDTNYQAVYQEPFGYEEKNSFRIYDSESNEIPYGLVKINRNHVVRHYNQHVERVNRHTITLEVNVPPMGTSEYKIVPYEEASRYLDVLSNNERQAENEYIKVTLNDDGTIQLTDKQSGRTYDQLLSYLDDGEIGDGWYHANPVEDRIVNSTGQNCVIERIENGPVRTVFQITQKLSVPKEMEFDESGIRRSKEYTTVAIKTKIGLSKGAKQLDVETTISNQAKDHRIRLVVPTSISSPDYFVNQPFAFVERKAGIRTETQSWRECDVPEKQMGGIVGKKDSNGRGIAFVSPFGLHECAALDDDQGTLHITLFRSFRKTVMTNGEEGGQINGDLTFKYALTVIDDETRYADLVRLQDQMQAEIHCIDQRCDKDYQLPESNSYFALDSANVCLSVLKRSEQDNKEMIVRLYNLSDSSSNATLTCYKYIESAEEVNLEEKHIQSLDHDKRSITLEFAPWKIKTVKITLNH